MSADKLTSAWPTDGIALDLPDWGWRKANIAGAVVCGVWALPCFLLLFHTPESVGCRPDGESAYAALAAEGSRRRAASSRTPRGTCRPPRTALHNHKGKRPRSELAAG